MEMNTRIQVEHCVTEEVVNFDLIKEQIKIAAGETISGVNYEPQGHAIECRINAEDPYNDFRPSPGRITTLHQPGGHGIRVDSHVYAGYTIPPYYDSMIAKIIAVARTRNEAIDTMHRALTEYVIEGIKTTIPFHLQLMKDENFRSGNFNTKFLEGFQHEITNLQENSFRRLITRIGPEYLPAYPAPFIKLHNFSDYTIRRWHPGRKPAGHENAQWICRRQII